MAQAAFGLLGKHPGYGDFLQVGLGADLADRLTGWLDPTLAALRDQMGQGWPEFWDNAQSLRFWIGRGITGRTLAGVLHPSRDRVGRRYPLLVLAEGVNLAPPTYDQDQTPWERIEALIDRMQPGQGAKALLEGANPDLPAEDAEAAAATGPTLWAHHPEGDLAALLRSAAPVEAERAELTRSHWWAPGRDDMAAVWLATPGLPTAQGLGWLLGGTPAKGADG